MQTLDIHYPSSHNFSCSLGLSSIYFNKIKLGQSNSNRCFAMLQITPIPTSDYSQTLISEVIGGF